MTAPAVRIVLASSSSARRNLLSRAGVQFMTESPRIDEVALIRRTGIKGPRAAARALALAKAFKVSQLRPDAVIIGADQTLELDGKLLAKPIDLADAQRRLRLLSGRTHALHSAFAIVRDQKPIARQTRTARLTMRQLSGADIDWYLGEVGVDVTSSVGAYQIEGLGLRLFERVDGDYFTILGLPMVPLLSALRRVGALAL